MRELGVRNLTFFPLQPNGDYGTPIKITNTVSLNVTNNYTERSYNSDCKTEYSSSSLQNVSVELEMSTSVPLNILSQITALSYDKNGRLVNKIGTTAPNGALAWEIVMDEGNNLRRRVLYNINLRRENWENETDSEGQTFKLVGTGVSKTFNDEEYIDLTMDSSEINKITVQEDKTKAQGLWNNFFTTVASPVA